MSQPRDNRQKELFRPALDRIIDKHHPLVRLAKRIDWRCIEREFGDIYSPGAGHPPLPVRLMAGLLVLQRMRSLSDKALCERWLENPYFQYFCGEEVFRHELNFSRSSLSRWRRRLGADRLEALIAQSQKAQA
ncbi:MAG: transposase [Hyphomicrobiales bacterium]|nr:transposase [Hyphomicrobiales bacterium]MBV9430560.1 transposase [Hyphomicrobiales bacterium]MBV9741061.1 transposase [Hyphomicrobiales bacterium]